MIISIPYCVNKIKCEKSLTLKKNHCRCHLIEIRSRDILICVLVFQYGAK
jgi:hypothetical protein